MGGSSSGGKSGFLATGRLLVRSLGSSPSYLSVEVSLRHLRDTSGVPARHHLTLPAPDVLVVVGTTVGV